MTGRARTSAEMHYAAALEPCPRCGTHQTGDLALYGQDTAWALTGACPKCGTPRQFGFVSIADPHDIDPAPFELGPGASELITVARFESELARLRPLVALDPERLAPEMWHASWQALRRLLTGANERLKVAPSATLELEREAWRALARRYQVDGDRIHALEHPIPSKGKLDPDSLRAHAGWLRRRRTGEGRLELVAVDLTNVTIGTQQLAGARFNHVVLSGANLRSSTLDDMLLSHVTAIGTTFTMGSIRGAYLDHGDYTRAHFELTDLDDIKIEGADCTGALFDRAIWKRARVLDTRLCEAYFGNSRFEDAEFTRCDLRGATFAPRERFPLPTTKARFDDCDLRDTDWTGRDLSGATFVRCKLAGAKGKPSAMTGLEVTECDLSRDALLRQILQDVR